MNEVRIEKSELLEILKKNREAHRAIFEAALAGYRKKAIQLLDKALKDAKEGRKINTWIQLQEPVDQTKDYDRAIRMIGMSVDENIEIGETDFANYVLDDWQWKQQFLTTNAMYTSVDNT